MPRKGVPQGPKGQQLSLFGRYISFLCRVLHTDQPEIAEVSGLSQSTISKVSKVSSRRLEEETVARIWQAFVTIAEQRGRSRILDQALYEGFYHAAHCATEEQIAQSEQHLQSLEILRTVDEGKRRS